MYKIGKKYKNLNGKLYIDSNFIHLLSLNFTESLFLKCWKPHEIFHDHTDVYFMQTFFKKSKSKILVYYVLRRTIRVIVWRATMLAGDRSRGAISPASIVASLAISRIVCIGKYSILCDFGADTSFYAYTEI